MQDKTIDSALIQLFRKCTLYDHAGKEHVLALMELRGIRVPKVYPDLRHVKLRRSILLALQERPMTLPELADEMYALRPMLARERTYSSTAGALWKMKKLGLVVNKGGVWGILNLDKLL